MPSLAELRKQKLKEQEDVKFKPVVEITPGDNNEKYVPAHDQKVSKPNLIPKKSNQDVNSISGEKEKVAHAQQLDLQKIDQQIAEIVNERLLKLTKIGLKHELTIENMMQYFREVKMAKLYELKRYFSDSSGYKIDQMLKFLYSSGELKKDKNNWYSLK